MSDREPQFKSVKEDEKKSLCALLGFFYADVIMRTGNYTSYDISLSAAQMCNMSWLCKGKFLGDKHIFFMEELHKMRKSLDNFTKKRYTIDNTNNLFTMEAAEYLKSNVEVCPARKNPSDGSLTPVPYDTNVSALIKAVPLAVALRK